MSGQASNLASLYAAEHNRLIRLLIQRGVCSTTAADLVQDAFLRMLRAPVGDVRDLRSYLFKTAGNIAIDEHRRQARASAIIDPVVELDATVADGSPQADAVLISAEELAALNNALSELPPRCREVLLLHKFEGLSYAEIADRLGIAKNTVMVHMAKAIRALRRRFREAPSSTG